MKKLTIKSNNLKNFIWNMIGTSLSSFVSLFFLIIVTRINGIEISGSFSFYFTISLILFTIATYGGRLYQVSDLKNEYIFNEYFSSRFLSSTISLLAIIIFALIKKYTGAQFIILLLMFIPKIIETFCEVLFAILQKNERLDIVGKSLTIKIVGGVIIFLILDVLFKNISIALLGYALWYIIIAIFYDFKKFKSVYNEKIIFLKSSFKILLTTKYIFLFSLLLILIINIPRYMVDLFLNTKEQGYFGIIIMLPSAISLVGQFIIQPSINSITKLYYDKKHKEYMKVLKKFYLYITVFSLFTMIALYYIGPWFFKLIYGLNFNDYKIALVIAIGAGALNVFTTIISTMLTIMRKTKIQFILYSITLLLGVLLSYVLVKNIGFMGSYYSLISIMAIQLVLFVIAFIVLIRKEEKK